MGINFVSHLLDYEYLSTFLGPYFHFCSGNLSKIFFDLRGGQTQSRKLCLKGDQTYYITGCHGACNSESIAAMNMQFFCITVYVHRLTYSIKMINLPFPQEAWHGDKILTYLLIKVSNEVTYLRETGPSRAILARGIQ